MSPWHVFFFLYGEFSLGLLAMLAEDTMFLLLETASHLWDATSLFCPAELFLGPSPAARACLSTSCAVQEAAKLCEHLTTASELDAKPTQCHWLLQAEQSTGG